MPKICNLVGVREYDGEDRVELWQEENGKITIVAFNEGGHKSTAIDLGDLLICLKEIGETLAKKDQP